MIASVHVVSERRGSAMNSLLDRVAVGKSAPIMAGAWLGADAQRVQGPCVVYTSRSLV